MFNKKYIYVYYLDKYNADAKYKKPILLVLQLVIVVQHSKTDLLDN